MSFLLSLPPSRRRCFALVASDCHRKVISHSDGHSIVKVHWRFLSPQGVAGWIRGEYQTNEKVFSLSHLLTNGQISLGFGKKIFNVLTFNCWLFWRDGKMNFFVFAYFRLKLPCFHCFIPSLVPKWVGRFGRSFLKKIFAQNTKTVEKPDKQCVFSG